MSDRPTPETDDQPVINAINENGYAVPCVDIEYARKLERELAEARLKITNLLDCHHEEHCTMIVLKQDDDIRRLQRERDEALMDRDNGDLATMTRNHYERILRERDEARSQLHIAVGLLSTHPQFETKHPEEVLDFVKEGSK